MIPAFLQTTGLPSRMPSDSNDEQHRGAKYVPVWLDDRVAHSRYDAYGYSFPLYKSFIKQPINNSLLAIISQLAMARRSY